MVKAVHLDGLKVACLLLVSQEFSLSNETEALEKWILSP